MNTRAHTPTPPPFQLRARTLKSELECLVCGVTFHSHKSTVSTCGARCRKKWSRCTPTEKMEICAALIAIEARVFIPKEIRDSLTA